MDDSSPLILNIGFGGSRDAEGLVLGGGAPCFCVEEEDDKAAGGGPLSKDEAPLNISDVSRDSIVGASPMLWLGFDDVESEGGCGCIKGRSKARSSSG